MLDERYKIPANNAPFLGVTTNLDLAGHLVLLQNMFVMRPCGIRLSHNEELGEPLYASCWRAHPDLHRPG